MRPLSQFRDDSKQSMAEEVLRQTGSLRMRVFGESMLPSIWPGDVITIKQHPASAFAIGDIGLFRKSERFVAHRIQKMVAIHDSLYFVTRGDSVPDNDPSFHESELLGKVTSVQRDDETPVPACSLSFWARLAGWVFCHCNRLRSLSLRVHAVYRLGLHRRFGGKNAQHGNSARLPSQAE